MMTAGSHAETSVRRAIEAADGWLALGSAQAAWEELMVLGPECQAIPAFLHQKARVLVAIGRMGEAKEMVRRLAKLAPACRLALLDDPALDPVWK